MESYTSVVPRKPTLSPSRITTFLACPVKYRWSYVDPRGKWYVRAKHYYSFGTTLHKVLQRFHDAGDAGVQTVEQAVEAVSGEWVAEGYASPEHAAQAQSEGRQIVEAYVQAAIEAPREARTLFLEKFLRVDMGEFDMIGRLDRVDEHPDGTLEVIDYKSGRLEVSPEDVVMDIGVCCYQLMLRRHYPDRPVRGTILALRTGVQASAALSERELEVFEEDLKVLGRQILSTDFNEVVPVFKPICPDCDFLALCRKHPEFDEPRGSP
jgi:hypothetical protein